MMDYSVGLCVLALLATQVLPAHGSLADTNLFDVNAPLATFREKKPRCWRIMRDFDMHNVDQYFRDDSVVTLAQAGSFVGVAAIREFFGFFHSDTSPFLASGPQVSAQQPYFLGKDDNGLCEILYAYKSQYTTDPTTTHHEATMEVSSMVKVYVDMKEGYVTEAHVYFAPGFLDYFFRELLSSETTHGFLCNDILTEVCRNHVPEPLNCMATLASLPETIGENLTVDGNSQSCRAMYASFALLNPANHSPHVALDQIADRNGEFRCQDSQELAVRSLFTSDDIRFFQAFLVQQEMRPNLGYLDITH